MNPLSNSIHIFKNLLNPECSGQLRAYVDELNITKPSFVFNVPEQKDEVNPKVRKSKTVTVNDIQLLGFIQDNMLSRFTEETGLVVKMARDYATFIKYEVGDFFDWHQDHEKYVIDERKRWVEMHFLYCIESAEEGGNLSIKTPDELKSLTYKENGCIVFDKLMEHCAEPVVSGRKVIMTIDVLVSKKEVVENPDLTLELGEALKNPDGFRTYGRSNFLKFVMKNPMNIPLFGVIEIKGNVLIYDSLGCYYFKDYRENMDWTREVEKLDMPEEKDSSWIQHKDPNIKYVKPFYQGGPPKFCQSNGKFVGNNFDLRAEIIGEEDVGIEKGSVDPVKLPNNLCHIPLGTVPDKILGLTVIDKPTKPEKISYSYHCNENNYDKVVVNHTIGVLQVDAI